MPKPVVEAPRDPTLRELRATLARLWSESENLGREREAGKLMMRAHGHMSFLLDAYLFDVDSWEDDGGRS